MKALVTGGAGFIGSHIVDALCGRGAEVLVIDDLSNGNRENLGHAIRNGARLVEASIVDTRAVGDAFAEHEPEIVFHLAAQMDVRRSVEDPVFDLSTNVAGTLNLLEELRRRKGVRLIFASTGGAIYGDGEGRELPFDESAECRPDAPYGASKLAAEIYLSLYERLYGVRSTCLRLGNVYGPRQDPHGEAGVVAIFSGALLAGETPRVFGTGEQTRDYVYVADVVDAFLAAGDADVSGVFNVGTGRETTVLELGERLAAVCDVAWDPELAPRRSGEVERTAIDPRKAKAELGWEAEYDLDHGLAETVRAFRESVRD